MRGLLLVVVVGAVLWLVVSNFRGDGTAGEGEQVTGFVVLPEGAPSAPASEAGTGAPQEPSPAAETPEDAGGGPPVAAAQAPSTELAAAEETVPAARPVIELGGPTGDTTELGRVLVASYLAGDPTALEAQINGGEGGPVAADTQLLIQAFWESVVRGDRSAEARVDELRGSAAVTVEQLRALEGASSAEVRAVPASATRDPLALAMRIVSAHRSAVEAERQGDASSAAHAYSSLIQLALRTPWPVDRSALDAWRPALNRAQDGARLDPRGTWPSIEYEVQPGDTLIGIRSRLVGQRPELLLCTGLIERVNALGKYIQPGQLLRVPTARPSVLVDLDARTLLYLHDDEVVRAWEVGVGKEGHETPVGTYTIGEKQVDPSWMPLGGPQLPYGHPENPLGSRWIAWFDGNGQKTSYGIHGTSDPDGVGGRVSQGCVRMRNDEVEELFELLPVGARVVVQP